MAKPPAAKPSARALWSWRWADGNPRWWW